MKIGITGGIGSGKTTVCKIFETLGIPIYYADDRAKQLMTESEELKAQIVEHFGVATYNEAGKINRAHLANIVFNNPDKLLLLNSLVHPAVHQDAEEWHHAQKNAPYTIKEAALLFESGSFRQLDKIICVYAPESARLQRVMQRDDVKEAQVLARMNKQLSDFDKIQLSDFVITNNQQQFLIQQVLKIHQTLLTWK
ncbi:MAG: dephospho-CoA kinase [Bacteroidota bacterium]